MFQEAERQIFHTSVAAEIGFAPKLAGLDAASVTLRVNHALTQTGLTALASAHPLDLNAGEKRLLTLASVIAQDTPLILLDEPTRDFDAPLLSSFERWMGRARCEGRTVLFISHDFDFVARQADRVLYLSDGSIVADGSAETVIPKFARQENVDSFWPTLPALARALNLPATTDPQIFDLAWRKRCLSQCASK